MGRTHSNAFPPGEHFFDLPYQPVLKAVCARNAARAEAFAAKVGLRIGGDGLARSWWNRRTSTSSISPAPTTPMPRSPSPPPAPGKMVMCEKPLGRNAAESEAMVEAVRGGGRRQHGLVQLPPRSRRHAGQAADRRGPPGKNFSLSRQVPAGLDDLDRSAAGRRRPVASGRGRGGQRRHGRPAGALHRHRHVAERPDSTKSRL